MIVKNDEQVDYESDLSFKDKSIPYQQYREDYMDRHSSIDAHYSPNKLERAHPLLNKAHNYDEWEERTRQQRGREKHNVYYQDSSQLHDRYQYNYPRQQRRENYGQNQRLRSDIYNPNQNSHHHSSQYPYHPYTPSPPSRSSSSSIASRSFNNAKISNSFENTNTRHTSSNLPMNVHYVTEITDNDVLCGRGGATNVHLGNRRFRRIVKDYQQTYLTAKKKDKPAVASFVVDLIRKKCPPGRFLKKDTNHNAWYDVGDVKAREKTSQALREGAPFMKRERLGLSSSGSTSLDDSKAFLSEKEQNDQHLKNSSPSKIIIENSAKADSATFSAKEKDANENDTLYEHQKQAGKRKITSISSSQDEMTSKEKELLAIFDPPRAKSLLRSSR